MKTHPLNVSYLVIGLAFLGITGSWALRRTGVIDAADMEWLLPLMLVVAGGIGLVAFVARGVTRRARTDAPAGGPFDDAVDQPESTLVFHDQPYPTDDQGETR
jgi:hypothetical protein